MRPADLAIGRIILFDPHQVKMNQQRQRGRNIIPHYAADVADFFIADSREVSLRKPVGDQEQIKFQSVQFIALTQQEFREQKRVRGQVRGQA